MTEAAGAETPGTAQQDIEAQDLETQVIERATTEESPGEDRPRKRRRRRRRRRPVPPVEEKETSLPQSTEKPSAKQRVIVQDQQKPKGGSEPRPAEPRPAEPRPAEPRPAESRSAESRPAESRSAESRSAEPKSLSELPPAVESTESAAAPERGIVFTLPERQSVQDERKIAMFCDFENIALGVRDSEIKELDINMVLARLLEKGKIIVKKAYADWERYSSYKRPFHEAAIELIDIPQKYYSGKNSADIKLVVDAMDLCYSKEHLDTFVILSGDSDFSPLVSKLKENNKYVIGIGVKNSSSSLLIDNCDEFIYYEDVWRATQQKPGLDNLPAKEAEVFGLMGDAMLALIRENKGVLWGSMIKQTMQRMRPSFNESYYGYSTFSELLEDASQKNIIGLKRDQRSGNYVVTGFIPSR